MSFLDFRTDLVRLINRNGVDAAVGCPDDVLADYIIGSIANFRSTIAKNTPERKWYPATPTPKPSITELLVKALESGSY